LLRNQGESLKKEYLKAVIIAIVLALFFRAFVVQAFKIPSESMVGTLLVGDHLLVNKMVYSIFDPQRGDIIVFKYPKDKSRDFVKRIVGLPREKIEIVNKQIFINGRLLNEPYAVYQNTTNRNGFGPKKVPEGHLFVMGDNRDNSQDSRFWGFLNIDDIIGKAFIVHWSWKDNSWSVRWDRVTKLLR